MTWSETFSVEKALQALEAGHSGDALAGGWAAEDDVYAQELRGLVRELDSQSALERAPLGRFNRVQPEVSALWMEDQT
jgi:hypothetical protein